MTLITFQDGKVVMLDGKVGTENACRCNDCCGPCDEQNPCPEGCCCCNGACVSEVSLCDVYVNGEFYPVETKQVEYPCWLPEIAPPLVAGGFDEANIGSAWITGLAGSGCEITIYWTSLACYLPEGGGPPSAQQLASSYQTQWRPCGVNAETGRTVLQWVSTTGDGPLGTDPGIPDFTGETIEMDCNELP
jgi:hypothetical protein